MNTQSISNHNPVAIYDSGIGGLTITKHIINILPNENIIYLADQRFAPYGNKKPEYLFKRTIEVCRYLQSQKIKCLLLGCNSITAIAVDQLREQFNFPIIAIEPALKPASITTRNNKVGVLATKATLESQKFKDLANLYFSPNELITQECNELAQKIENYLLKNTPIQEHLIGLIEPLLKKEIDTLLLGCTHYPLIIKEIKQLLYRPVNIVDNSLAVANHLKKTLTQKNLLSSAQKNHYDFFSTKATQHLENYLNRSFSYSYNLKEVSI